MSSGSFKIVIYNGWYLIYMYAIKPNQTESYISNIYV